MLQRAESAPSFSLARSRQIVADLFVPKPWIYWTDFLLSALVGNTCFAIAIVMLRNDAAFLAAWPLAAKIAVGLSAYVACSLAFYRMSLFIHELVHLRSGTMLGFRAVWNVLCGIPFLMPSFVYYTHMGHHRRQDYGTDKDGEYLPFGHETPGAIVKHLAYSFIIPILVVTRFLIIGPLSWFIPSLRRWVLRHASSMVIDFDYVRPLPSTRREAWTIFIQEILCFLWLLGIAIVPPVFLGRWPIPFVILGYSVAVFILTINAIRTLGGHRYGSDGHDDISFEAQLLDSVNVHRHPLITELWGPIGTRYHALHHLFPALPYHAMPEAHRRLMAQLPQGSPYHQTEEPSLTAALVDLWRRSREVAHAAPRPADKNAAAVN